jgi:hypothetical protein
MAVDVPGAGAASAKAENWTAPQGRSKRPTRTWWVAGVTAGVGWLATWTAGGHWPHISSQLLAALITIGLQLLLAYLVSNKGWLAKRRYVQGFGSDDRWPTEKWWVATTTVVIGFPVIYFVTGHWTRALTSQVIVIIGQRFLAYFVPNG